MREFKKATNEIKETMHIDSEFSDVKKAFNDINEDVKEAVEFIEEHAARGESVYVHCKAGRARSATVVLCWLMKRHGMSPIEGQQLLLERRPHVNKRLAERPVVLDYWQTHAAADVAEPPEQAR